MMSEPCRLSMRALVVKGRNPLVLMLQSQSHPTTCACSGLPLICETSLLACTVSLTPSVIHNPQTTPNISLPLNAGYDEPDQEVRDQINALQSC